LYFNPDVHVHVVLVHSYCHRVFGVYVFRELEENYFPVVEKSDAERDIILSAHPFQMVTALEVVSR